MNSGAKIKKARLDCGFTQKHLASLIGAGESTVRQYELGIRNPKIETLSKIAKALDISLYDILDDVPREILEQEQRGNDFIENIKNTLQKKLKKHGILIFCNYLESLGFKISEVLEENLNSSEDKVLLITPNEKNHVTIAISDLVILSNEFNSYIKYKLDDYIIKSNS